MRTPTFIYELLRKFRYLSERYPIYKRRRELLVYRIASEVNDVEVQITLIIELARKYEGPRRKYRYLTTTEKHEIIDLYLKGHSIYSIAKKLGRSTSVVYNVLRKYGLLRKNNH